MESVTKEDVGLEKKQFAYIAYFDGASQGNPGPSGIGGVVKDPCGQVLLEISEPVCTGTNNEAEYKALIAVARRLSEMGVPSALIQGDSQLVVNQVNGLWRINHSHLYQLCQKAQEALNSIPEWSLNWIPREKNTHADALSTKAISAPAPGSSASPFTGRLEQITATIFLAHGTGVYAVDVARGACTCPSFTTGKTRPCKHVIAAGYLALGV
jgi:ribonuclease HI